MARSAVLAGRTLADLVRNVFVVVADGDRRLPASGGASTRTCSALLAGVGADAVVRATRSRGCSRSSVCTRRTPKPRRRRRSRSWRRSCSCRRRSCRRGTMPGPLEVVRRAPAGFDRDRRGAVADLRRHLRRPRQGAGRDPVEPRNHRRHGALRDPDRTAARCKARSSVRALRKGCSAPIVKVHGRADPAVNRCRAERWFARRRIARGGRCDARRRADRCRRAGARVTVADAGLGRRVERACDRHGRRTRDRRRPARRSVVRFHSATWYSPVRAVSST